MPMDIKDWPVLKVRDGQPFFYKISSKFAGKAFESYISSINIIGEVSIFPGGQIVLQPEVKICKMHKGQLTEKFPNLLSTTVPMWYLFLLIS